MLNLGGVGNVTWIGADEALIAFDTGPGNGPLDDWMARRAGAAFDRDGALARSGQVDAAVLNRLLADPYFSRPPPKSLDRLDFAAVLAASGLEHLSPADGAATLVAFTAATVAAAPLPAKPLRWVVTGGGRHNPAIMTALRDRLGVPVDPVETLGWNGDALEAQCFGFLAARTRAGLPISFPGTTGVPRPTIGRPDNAGRLVAASAIALAGYRLAAVVVDRLGHLFGVLGEHVVGACKHPVVDAHALLGVQLVHQLMDGELRHEFIGVAVQHQPAARAGREEAEIIMVRRRRDADPAGDLRPAHQQLHADERAERVPGDPQSAVVRVHRLHPVERRRGVTDLANAAVIAALAATDPRKLNRITEQPSRWND